MMINALLSLNLTRYRMVTNPAGVLHAAVTWGGIGQYRKGFGIEGRGEHQKPL